MRLLVLAYLVLPQTQGARLLYQSYIHPFLARHEHDIDRFIDSAHHRAKSAGLAYLNQMIGFVKENFLGMQRSKPVASAYPHGGDAAVAAGLGGGTAGGSYAQNLLSRFSLPAARQGFAAPAGDFYTLLSSAVGNISTAPHNAASREAQVDSLSRSGTLIPRGMTSPTEKMTFIATQREKLRVLLSALDREASDLGTEAAIERDVDRRVAGAQLGVGSGEGLKKSKSEAEFEEIGTEGPGVEQGKMKGGAGSWMPWGWSGKGAEAQTTGMNTGS